MAAEEQSMRLVQRRRRTTLACRRCRERKTRCSGVKPQCAGCMKSGATCVYYEAKSNRLEFVLHDPSPASSLQPKDERLVGSNGVFRIVPSAVYREDPSQEPAGRAPSTSHQELPQTRDSEKAATGRSARIPFFRWFGPTGIAPGYKKMLYDVQQTGQGEIETRSRRGSPVANPPATAALLRGVSEDSRFFEEDGVTPKQTVLYPLLQTFFDHYECHFPFYSRTKFTESIRAGKVSALVLNSICGLAARFTTLSELQHGPVHLRGDIFAEKAKHLLVPMMNLPSYDVVASILMFVWLELGSNHDVGVWMYMGLACRMAMDLGMHKNAISGPGTVNDPHEYWIVSSMFWAVNFLDHIISFATGRPLSIDRKHIDVPFPQVATSPSATSGESSSKESDPFLSMVVVIQALGLVHEEMSSLSDSLHTLSSDTVDRLKRYNDELITYYVNLHHSLSFNVQNFQQHAAKGTAGNFLLLHVWFNAIMIGIHRPGLRYRQSTGASGLCLTNESRSIALSSARTITSILSLAEVVDLRSVLASPFIDQAVEMAGLVFVAESLSSSDTLKKITNQSNYEVCLHTLQALVIYWKGIGWVTTVLEQKAVGMDRTNLAEGSADREGLVHLRDSTMIQKLLEKAELRVPNQFDTDQTSIGIGFSGMTSDLGQGNIMILQPAATEEPIPADLTSVEQRPSNDWLNAFNPDSNFTSQSAHIDTEAWTTWLDASFWSDLDVPVDLLDAT